MNERIKQLKERLNVDEYPICSEKAGLVIDSFKRSAGLPNILRRALATAHYLDNKSIFIEDDELIVGNVASRPMGMEAGTSGPTWPDDDLDDLLKGKITITPDDRANLRAMDSYWLGKQRTMDEWQGRFYDDDRLWPFIKSGLLIPPWQQKDQGRGQGSAGVGWGLGNGLTNLVLPDYAKVVHEGINELINDAREELKGLRYRDGESVIKADFLQATIIAFEAIARLANRYACLAEEMAKNETDTIRQRELEVIAQICRRVPALPATTLWEGIQSFWFYWMMIASGTAPGGRFDQYMYPLYQNDLAEGRLTDETTVELLECLRIKIMQMNFVGGGKGQREKWAGMARWNNFVIGGVTSEGKDATNDLTYLVLEAAKDCQCPHPTITLRVHEDTPEKLMIKALDVVRTGIGFPAFISDASYIAYLTGEGVPIEEARDYGLAGCLDVNLPGKSRIVAFGMFSVPKVLEITINNGVDPRTGMKLGLDTGEFANFQTYGQFLGAFKEQLKYFLSMVNEEHNILLHVERELFPDVVHSALMADGIKVGKDALSRTMPFENGSAINMVGLISAVDSLAAIKKVVFEETTATTKELKDALDANWSGYEELQRACLAAPKYGNGNTYVDSIAKKLFQYCAETIKSLKSIYGASVKPTAISITAHAPGGQITGATPDGRFSGETFADGSLSPGQGRDINGPTAVLRSAMAVNQVPFQATLLNMKFHPTAMKTEEDLRKLASLIKTYFENGGKHVQFNVVDTKTLCAAQERPGQYRDLIVRVAGYSTYFVTLTKRVQDEIIARQQHML